MQRIATYLSRARRDPGLRFEGETGVANGTEGRQGSRFLIDKRARNRTMEGLERI